MRAWIVVVPLHARMCLERALNDRPLHAYPASVHQPHLPQSGGVGFVDVFLYD